MKLNAGSIDRIIRIVVALIIGALYFMNIITGTLGIILLVVAVIMLITGAIGSCPAYCIFKITTR